jgi:hypothetical protein
VDKYTRIDPNHAGALGLYLEAYHHKKFWSLKLETYDTFFHLRGSKQIRELAHAFCAGLGRDHAMRDKRTYLLVVPDEAEADAGEYNYIQCDEELTFTYEKTEAGHFTLADVVSIIADDPDDAKEYLVIRNT